MARNPYFKDYSGEQNVIEDLSIEIIKTMGRDILYIPREQFDKDIEFGEASYKYNKIFPIEMYIASVSGFEGEGDIISKFGLEVRDKVTFVVSRKRFKQEVTDHYQIVNRPREGDLIYFPITKGLFEINFVEHENPFYQAGKLYTYLLICELTTLDLSNDEISTGESDVDIVIQETRKPIYSFSLGTQITPDKTFFDGETVFQVYGVTGGTYSQATAEAESIKYYPKNKTLNVYGISGSFNYAGQTIKGQQSGAEFYVTGVNSTNIVVPISPVTQTTEQGDNESINLDGDKIKIYDFTDIDPFSEGVY